MSTLNCRETLVMMPQDSMYDDVYIVCIERNVI